MARGLVPPPRVAGSAADATGASSWTTGSGPRGPDRKRSAPLITLHGSDLHTPLVSPGLQRKSRRNIDGNGMIDSRATEQASGTTDLEINFDLQGLLAEGAHVV